MSPSKISNYAFLKIAVLPVLLFNPVILYLLTKSVLASLITPIFAIAIAYFSTSFSSFLKVFTINILVLVSILIHAEVLFRFGFPDYIIENLYEIRNGFYFNKPNLVEDIQDKEYRVLYKTNVQGFRMPASINQDKEINRCDWLFIGDSFTQGAQVEFRNLFTSQTYRSHPDKVIVNAGISGFGILDELRYYEREGYKLMPRKVILQLCSFNDFMKVKISRNSFSEYLMQYSDFARFLLYGLKYKSPGELPLGRWTEPFYPSEQDNRDFNIFFKENSQQKNSDIEAFKNALIEFKKAVEKNNSQFYVFLIPTKEQVYPRYLEEVKTTFNLKDDQIDLFLPNYFMDDLCDSLNINFIDLLPGYLEGQEAIFYEYDEHLTPYGHFLTAQLLEPFFFEEGRSNKASLVSDNFLGERYPSCWGNKLLLQANRDGNMEIVFKDLLNGTEDRMTFNDIDECHPTLNPQRNLLAFTEGDAEKMTTKVSILDLNSMSRSYLDSEPYTFSAIPAFSPDGSMIAYAEWNEDPKNNKFSNSSIVIQNLINLNEKVNVSANDKFESWRPVFTPDGSSIVFISKKSGNFDIFQTNLSTGTTIQLTDSEYDEWDPSISPDGKKIIYAGFIDKNWDLIEMDIETRIQKRLTDSIGDEWDPVYCLAGDSVIYAGEFGFYTCIYKIDL